ncbi:MAG: hypothetical protein J6Q16_01235 [Clostridia bacterium]|nr:hypothetical protein [Clostridia bacterium]
MKEAIITADNIQAANSPCRNIEGKALGKKCLMAAFILPVGMYLSELTAFLEEPVFNYIYYGNLNTMFYHLACTLFILGFFALFHSRIKNLANFTPFAPIGGALPVRRKILLYFMTLIPVFITSAALDFRFKLVYGLGEKVTAMTLLGNGVGYIHTAAKLLCVMYFIVLVEEAFEAIFHSVRPIPVGGILAALTFGIGELMFAPSAFTLLYLFLIGYFGVVYILSEKRFVISYVLALIMYIL